MDATTALLIAALISGLLTIVFVLGGLRAVASTSGPQRVRQLAAALIFSVITGVLTIVQMLATAQQLGLW